MGWLSNFLQDDSFGLVVLIIVCGGLIFCVAKGWLLTPFQVKNLLELQNMRIAEANKRGDEWRDAYNGRAASLDTALEQVDRLKSVGDTANRVLSSLPVPPNQGTSKKDEVDQ